MNVTLLCDVSDSYNWNVCVSKGNSGMLYHL